MARKYENVKLLLPAVRQMQAEGKTRKEIAGDLGLQSERAAKNLRCRTRHRQEKAIPKQRGRTPVTFPEANGYPVKNWRGAACTTPLLTKPDIPASVGRFLCCLHSLGQCNAGGVCLQGKRTKCAGSAPALQEAAGDAEKVEDTAQHAQFSPLPPPQRSSAL